LNHGIFRISWFVPGSVTATLSRFFLYFETSCACATFTEIKVKNNIFLTSLAINIVGLIVDFARGINLNIDRGWCSRINFHLGLLYKSMRCRHKKCKLTTPVLKRLYLHKVCDCSVILTKDGFLKWSLRQEYIRLFVFVADNNTHFHRVIDFRLDHQFQNYGTYAMIMYPVSSLIWLRL
jgi:hypothetical protein